MLKTLSKAVKVLLNNLECAQNFIREVLYILPQWLSSAKAVVLRKYRGKYVAIRNKRVLAASTTMKGLYAKIDRLNPGMVLITKVERPALLVMAFAS